MRREHGGKSISFTAVSFFGLLLLGFTSQGLLANPARNEVTVAGITVARFRVAAGGFTPVQRAEILEDRIVSVFSQGDLAVKPVEIRGKPTEPALYVGNQLLVTITAADAAANHDTPMGLASRWQLYFSRALPAGRPLPMPLAKSK
jgi:hypothetical protein